MGRIGHAILVRIAEPDDWPQIDQWRADHFARMASRMESPRDLEGQPGPDDAVWLVLERDGVAVAVTAYTQWKNTLFGKAMFAAPGHVRDGLKLADWLEQFCDDEGFELVAQTDPENTTYIRLLEKRGYTQTSVELTRRPKA